jgi:uncharacterized protein
MTDLQKLVGWFLHNADGALVALSGGVDSAVVALAASKALGNNSIAVTADYKTLAAEELESARVVSKEIGVRHMVIEYDELENPEFVKNDGSRCYHCRTELGQRLAALAEKLGISVIVDGTHIDDLSSDYRPGIRALRENGVRSPLAELGIGKAAVRQIAKDNGLSVYDRPSNACLASRIPAGMEVTYEKLRRIENAEIAVKSIFGVRQVRVRDHGEIARIEVGKEELSKLFDGDKLALADAKLKEIGFKFVAVDAAGYRQGKLAVVENQ